VTKDKQLFSEVQTAWSNSNPMNMTHGTNGARPDQQVPPRPSSEHSHSGSQSSASGSKHVKCIGRYVLTQHTLGKGNFARVEAAVHTLTRAKVNNAVRHSRATLHMIAVSSLFTTELMQL